jgi:hypothetical protein
MIRSLRRRWRGARLARADWLLVAVVVLAGAFYEWTARTSVSGPSHSYYYMLADSFLHLHTYLPIPVPPGLAALPNPYDPAANAPFGGHDLAYFHDHFYLSWLPGPVVVLYLPLRLLDIELTDANAVPIFCLAALTFAVLLLRFVVLRFLPRTKTWMLVAAACALAFGTAIPFLLRRPAIYEVAIASGACFMMAALYLLTRGLLDEHGPRTWLLALASLCAGLAFASRPPMLLAAVPFAVVAVAIWRSNRLPSARRRRTVIALLAPVAACIALIGAYNAQRFGSPAQFGVKYVLAGIDQAVKPLDELAYVVPGVYNFVLAPPRLALTFPHVFLPPPPNYPGTLPAGYAGTPSLGAEPTGGVIPMAPIVLFIAALPLLWRRRDKIGREVPIIVGSLWLLGSGIVLGLAFTLFGTTERYEVDFDLLLILAGVVAWLGLTTVVRRRAARRVSIGLGALAVAWSCFTGVAVSITGYYNELLTYHPGMFAALEDLTGPLATLPTMILGRPVIARVQSPIPVIYGPVDYLTFGQGQASTYLGDGPVELVVLSPRAETVALRAVISVTTAVPKGTPTRVVVSSSGERRVSVPASPGVGLIPIHLHWGLNRIELLMAGPQPGVATIGLGDMILVKRVPPAHAS